MKYRYIQDPGHGWLEVPLAQVLDLGIAVSAYSYINRKTNTVYLEEDCDMSRFLIAKGVTPKSYGAFKAEHIIEVHDPRDCFVRNLPRWITGPKTGMRA